MSFFKRTKDELNNKFLKAVSQGRFQDALAWVRRGANIKAQDKDGNNAFHLLAKADPFQLYSDAHYATDAGRVAVIDKFICRLIEEEVDIDAPNHTRKRALHLAVANKKDENAVVAEILINRGARRNMPDTLGRMPLHYVCGDAHAEALLRVGTSPCVRDNMGITPLHRVAHKGLMSVAEKMVKASAACLAMADKQGRYPHDWARDNHGNHYLAHFLTKAYGAYVARRAQEEELKANGGWCLVDEQAVGHVTVDRTLGYRLTEVFNFERRTYTLITQNLETKAETPTVRAFEEFAENKALLDQARQHLDRLKDKGQAPKAG